MPPQVNGHKASKLPPKCLERDITQSPTFLEIKRRHVEVLRPGKNDAADMMQLDISPDGKKIADVATICTELKGSPTTKLVVIKTDIKDANLEHFGERKGSDTCSQWSPDGTKISFLSPVNENNQVHILDYQTGDVKQCTDLNGTIEQQSWSQDGDVILLTVAGLGADRAGADGAVSLADKSKKQEEMQDWMPQIEQAAALDEYRTLWTYKIKSVQCELASPAGLNFWEAEWSSPTKVVGICSDLPGEDYWYTSTIREIDLSTGFVRTLFFPEFQVEFLAASPSASKIAFTHTIASDRGILKGDFYLLETSTGKTTKLDTQAVDVGGSVYFCGEDNIVASGSRLDEELVIQFDCKTGQTLGIWKSHEYSNGSHYIPEVAARMVGQEVQVSFVRAGWFSPPVLVHVTKADLKEIRTFGSSHLHDHIRNLGSARYISWKAPDGLEIHGYPLTPANAGSGPLPTVLSIHGGPVWQWRPRYIGGHGQTVLDRSFLANGFAIFKPNVRGSSGRGQSFIREVYGDMGGKDTYDHLSGLEHLVDSGHADPKRLGTYGGSYGGFMSSWLITQTTRFAAAVPLAPVTDWVSLKYTSNIGRFVDDFLASSPHDPNGKYFTRSPIHHANNVIS